MAVMDDDVGVGLVQLQCYAHFGFAAVIFQKPYAPQHRIAGGVFAVALLGFYPTEPTLRFVVASATLAGWAAHAHLLRRGRLVDPFFRTPWLRQYGAIDAFVSLATLLRFVSGERFVPCKEHSATLPVNAHGWEPRFPERTLTPELNPLPPREQ